MNFRIQKKKLGLTYPQCPYQDAVFRLLKKKIPYANQIIVGQEAHKDEGLHQHCYIQSVKKIETEDVRFFDLEIDGSVYHPNICKGEAKPAWRAYCLKEDEKPLIFAKLDDSNPVGFCRRKRDFDEWEAHIKKKRAKSSDIKELYLTEEWLNINTGEVGGIHRFTGRDGGGLVLIGPTAIRKSTMIMGSIDIEGIIHEGLLSNEEVHTISNGQMEKYHYENYRDQPWIVYDDAMPVVGHLLHILNRYLRPMKVPGEPRYQSVMMSPSILRNVIVIGNHRLSEINWNQEGLNSRFQVWSWTGRSPSLM